MKNRKIPIEIEFESQGTFNDILFDFTNTIKKITGDIPNVEIDFKGKVTINITNQKIEKRPYYDIDALYRGDYTKMNESFDPAMKNNESGDDSRRHYKPIQL